MSHPDYSHDERDDWTTLVDTVKRDPEVRTLVITGWGNPKRGPVPGMFEDFDHPVTGRTRLPRHPTDFHGTPARLGGFSPALGEHTDEVLTEMGLGDRVEELRAAGVVA